MSEARKTVDEALEVLNEIADEAPRDTDRQAGGFAKAERLLAEADRVLRKAEREEDDDAEGPVGMAGDDDEDDEDLDDEDDEDLDDEDDEDLDDEDDEDLDDEDDDEDDEDDDEDEGPGMAKSQTFQSLDQALLVAHNRTARWLGRVTARVDGTRDRVSRLAKSMRGAVAALRDEVHALRAELESVRGQRNAPRRPRSALVTPLTKSVSGVNDAPRSGVPSGRLLVKAACDWEVAGKLAAGDGVLTEMYVNRGATTVDDVARMNPALGQRLLAAAQG